MRKLIFIMLIVLVTVSCSFAPKYVRPAVELPEQLSNTSGGDNYTSSTWWKYFNDDTLNLLMEEAINYNKDIMIAIANVDKAKANYGINRSDMLPTVDGNAGLNKTWINNKNVTGSTPSYSATLSAAWEIDLFGKYRNSSSSAFAKLIASDFARRGVILSVVGEVASSYFNIISLDTQLVIAESTVKSREESLEIYNIRYINGLIGELDFMQMKTSVENAKTALYRTRLNRDVADTNLMILLGKSPKDIMDNTSMRNNFIDNITVVQVIPSNLPSSLLENRPDIREAEYNVMSTNFDIGVAKAAYFPTISLTGMFGGVSSDFKKFYTSWGYGAGLNIPILNFGKIRNGVHFAEASQRLALANYEKTIQLAFKDVRNALVAQSEYLNIIKSLENMKKELETAYSLVKLRYSKGYSSYLDVLDTERSLFQTELDLAEAKKNYLTSVVSVFMALGY